MLYKSVSGLFYVDGARQVWRVFDENTPQLAVCPTKLDADVVTGMCSKYEPDDVDQLIAAIYFQVKAQS